MGAGIRSIRKHPSFSAIAVLTLAIGIAANAVVFAVVKSVVLRPLPYGNADRLVTIAETDSHRPNADTVSDETVRAWRERARALDHLSVYGDSSVRPIVGSHVEQLRGMWVSADFFETLGVPMYLGRSFRPEEDLPEPQNVLILTYGAWSELFGADPSIVGRFIPVVGGAY